MAATDYGEVLLPLLPPFPHMLAHHVLVFPRSSAHSLRATEAGPSGSSLQTRTVMAPATTDPTLWPDPSSLSVTHRLVRSIASEFGR